MPEKEEPVSIKIYSSRSCTQCAMTKRLYDRDGVGYETVMIDNNEIAQARLKAAGHQQLPVVVTDTETWTGFQPERVKASIEHYKASRPASAAMDGPSIA
jgi:glutaredoxin-like protein NrdH